MFGPPLHPYIPVVCWWDRAPGIFFQTIVQLFFVWFFHFLFIHFVYLINLFHFFSVLFFFFTYFVWELKYYLFFLDI